MTSSSNSYPAPGPRDMSEDYRRLVDLTVAQSAQITELHVDGHVLAVALVDGEPIAFQALCPHDKAGLASGRIEGCTLVCPRHLARFDLRSGAVSAGWKINPLRLYPARIIDGWIAIDMAAVGRNPPGGARKVWDLS